MRPAGTASKDTLWQPHPDNKPQQLAWESDADVIGYGGQAGGGKTDLLIGSALTRHKKSVIFRREGTQLRDIIDRSKEIIGGGGRFNESLHFWRGLPGERTLEFGGVKDDDDVEKWRGRPHDLKAFDEGTEFTESQIRFLIGWNRSTDPNQKCQAIIAFNPPRNAGGRWIIKFFDAWLNPQHPNPAKPGELRWFAMVNDEDVERPDGEPFEHNGETIKPRSRTFIPASLKDNPYLANTDYEANLQGLPEPLRSQLLRGDFAAGIADDAWQIIPTDWVKLAQARWTAEPPKDKDGNAVPLSAVAVDVARGGQDKGVFAGRHDNWFAELIKYPGVTVKTGPSLISKLIDHLKQAGAAKPTGETVKYESEQIEIDKVECAAPVNVDAIGVGSSPVDTGRLQGLNVNDINWAEGSKERDKTGKFGFINKRAEHWWKFREALDPEHGENIALPPDSELLADLTAPRYAVQTNGIKVEAKDDIKKRIGRSPDCGDAVVMAKAGVGWWIWQ